MPRYEFRLPDIGEGLAEAEISRWLVSVGDHVVEDQPVLEMTTDKATVEIPSPGAGVVVERLAEEGEIVKTGTVLYILETDGPPPGASEAANSVPVPASSGGTPAAESSAGGNPPGAALAAPTVRRRARELGVDLAQVRGSGPGGRISGEDVERHAASAVESAPVASAAASPAVLPAGQRVALRGVQRRMAETMALSARTIPHVTGFHELDAASLLDVVARLKARASARGARFPFDALLVRAAAVALERHPIFNSSLDAERGEIVYRSDRNVGVATATPNGLVVVVVKDAGRADLDELAAEVDRVTSAARTGRVELVDLQGGTMTISNTGAWRGGHGTSLIRPPEVALVGFGGIAEKAVVRDGQVVARPVLPMSVTFDHRVIDGEQGLTFALTLRSLLEEAEQLASGAS